MGWHDATVHAIGFDEDKLWAERLLLDLDYIVESIEPAAPDESFSFLVAPATLVFEGVGVIEAELHPSRLLLTIDEIRHEPESEQASDADVVWVIEGDDLDLRFSARGFHQHFRSAPINTGRSRTFDPPAAGRALLLRAHCLLTGRRRRLLRDGERHDRDRE